MAHQMDDNQFAIIDHQIRNHSGGSGNADMMSESVLTNGGDSMNSYGGGVGNKTERDVTDFVKYLLEGSGVEDQIDFQAIRKELEMSQDTTTNFSGTASFLLHNQNNQHNESSLSAMGVLDEPSRFTSASLPPAATSSRVYDDHDSFINNEETAAHRHHNHDNHRQDFQDDSFTPIHFNSKNSESHHQGRSRKSSLKETPPLSESTPIVKKFEKSNSPTASAHSRSSLHRQYSNQHPLEQENTIEDRMHHLQINDSIQAQARDSSLYHRKSPIHPNFGQQDLLPSQQQQQQKLNTSGGKAKNNDLQKLSDALAGVGFPPLHPALLFARLNEEDFLSPRQIQALYSTFEIMITEYERRGEMIQNLIQRVSNAEERAYEWQSKATVSERVRNEELSVDMKKTEELQESLQSARQEVNELTNQLGIVRAEAADLQTKLSFSEKTIQEQSVELNILRQQTELLKSSPSFIVGDHRHEALPSSMVMDASSSLNKNTSSLRFTSAGPPDQRVQDQVALGIIEAYEGKVQLLKDEIKKLKEEKGSANGLLPKGRFDTLDEEKSAQTQINLLQKHLVQKDEKIQELSNQMELMKLKQLSKKQYLVDENGGDGSSSVGGNHVVRGISRPKNFNTRELIKRDKRLWKLKTFAIDHLTLDESQDLLKLVCINLDVTNIEDLPFTLQDIDKALRLIPEMQKFIYNMDRLTWPVEHHNTATGLQQQQQLTAAAPHKLSLTAQILKQKLTQCEFIPTLQEFKSTIYKLLSCQDNEKEELVVEKLKHFLEQGDQEDKKIEYKALTQFRELFDVTNLRDLLPKINELYIFDVEVKAGLKRLSKAIGKTEYEDEAAKILIYAAEKLETILA